MSLLESVINESRKLEVANHESVRVVVAQLDRAKRIIIVQQAITSAVSRSNLSDLDISIATAQQLVGHDRPWLLEANKSRCAIALQVSDFTDARVQVPTGGGSTHTSSSGEPGACAAAGGGEACRDS